MNFHKMTITKAGEQHDITCAREHAEESEIQQFNGFRAAIDAGWRRKDGKFICPVCARKEGVE